VETIVKLAKISKNYDDLEIVENINLGVIKGEFLSLIGPNGCGKSTIIKILAGIITEYHGEVITEAKTAYVPQQSSLLPWLSVIDNLIFPSKINRVLGSGSAKDLLKQFELDEFADFYPKQLSGGMQQKLSILRAVNTMPDVLLLDEPFSSLDSITRRSMQDWLKLLIESRGLTTICVTHDIQEAARMSDRVAVLTARPGSIIRLFTTKDIEHSTLQSKLEKLLLV
jgi:ABC-type nitrate/sulfonate/bicarbonate transport system ATPase subunit